LPNFQLTLVYHDVCIETNLLKCDSPHTKNNLIGPPTFISVTSSAFSLSHTSNTCNSVSLDWWQEEKWRTEQTGCCLA